MAGIFQAIVPYIHAMSVTEFKFLEHPYLLKWYLMDLNNITVVYDMTLYLK